MSRRRRKAGNRPAHASRPNGARRSRRTTPAHTSPAAVRTVAPGRTWTACGITPSLTRKVEGLIGRRDLGLAAVYTQTTDVEGEVNGFLNLRPSLHQDCPQGPPRSEPPTQPGVPSHPPTSARPMPIVSAVKLGRPRKPRICTADRR